MNRFRITILLAAVAGVAGDRRALAGGRCTKLTGTVGPGFTITLKKAGKKVTTLTAGTYSITVVDKSNIHNFHLRGPGGVNKEITADRLRRDEDRRRQAGEGDVQVRVRPALQRR